MFKDLGFGFRVSRLGEFRGLRVGGFTRFYLGSRFIAGFGLLTYRVGFRLGGLQGP